MRSYHLLTEAELSAEQQKLLSLLSDEDLESIVGELDEAEGGRFAYDPLKRPTSAPQPTKQTQPKPQPKADPVRKAEIKQTVDTLKPKEKSALVKAAKAELKQRETKPKEVKPAQPGTLKKVVKNLALAALAATVIGGIFGGGDNAPSGADVAQQPAAVTQQAQQSEEKKIKAENGIKWLLHVTNNSQTPNYDIKTPNKLFKNNKIKSINIDSSGTGTVVGLVDGKNELTIKLDKYKIQTATYSEDYVYSDYIGNTSKLKKYMYPAGTDLSNDSVNTAFAKGKDVRDLAVNVSKYVEKPSNSYLTRPGDKGKYQIVSTRTWEDNPDVTITLSSRINADGTTSYTVRGIDSKNNLVHELPSGVTNTSDNLSTMRSIFNGDIKFDSPTDIGRGTIQAMLRDALPSNKTINAPTNETLLTGNDFITIAKNMTLPGQADPTKDPNIKSFARAINLDNGKYYKLPKPSTGSEAELFQSIMLSTISDSSNVIDDLSIDKDVFLKEPIRYTLRYSLSKKYPVEK
jgi:hypothetical protein